MPDVSIVNQSVTAVPDAYTVPGAQNITVKAVRADLDGTGAAVAYLPALQLLDPAGHVMWTAVDPSTSVAAGGSASVSWFRGVNRKSGGASFAPLWATYFSNSPTVAAGGNAAATLTLDSGTNFFDFTSPTVFKVTTAGLYTFHSWVQSTDAWTAGRVGGGTVSVANASDFTQLHNTGTAGADGTFHNTMTQATAIMRVGDSFGLSFDNFDTVNHTMFSNMVYVVQHFTI